MKTVVEVNDDRKAGMADRVEKAMGGSVEGKRIAILGLAFKQNTDDMRDAPSIPLVNSLLEQGAIISAYDPVATENARKLMAGADFANDAYTAAKAADALVVVTEWDEFRALDLDRFAKVMAGKLIVDLRNVYSRSDAEEAGFEYIGLGRGRIDGGPRLKLVKNGPEAAAR